MNVFKTRFASLAVR